MKTIKYQQLVSAHIDYLDSNVYDVAPELLFSFKPKMKKVTCNMYVQKFPEQDDMFKSYQIVVSGEIIMGTKNWLEKYPSSSYFLELHVLPEYNDKIQCDFDDNEEELKTEIV
jgi:hypothetical protein